MPYVFFGAEWVEGRPGERRWVELSLGLGCSDRSPPAASSSSASRMCSSPSGPSSSTLSSKYSGAFWATTFLNESRMSRKSALLRKPAKVHRCFSPGVFKVNWGRWVVPRVFCGYALSFLGRLTYLSSCNDFRYCPSDLKTLECGSTLP